MAAPPMKAAHSKISEGNPSRKGEHKRNQFFHTSTRVESGEILAQRPPGGAGAARRAKSWSSRGTLWMALANGLSPPCLSSIRSHSSCGDQPRSGTGGDKNLIAATLSYPLYYGCSQSMTSPDRRHGRFPLRPEMSKRSATVRAVVPTASSRRNRKV